MQGTQRENTQNDDGSAKAFSPGADRFDERTVRGRAAKIKLATRKLNELLRDLPDGLVVDLEIKKPNPLAGQDNLEVGVRCYESI